MRKSLFILSIATAGALLGLPAVDRPPQPEKAKKAKESKVIAPKFGVKTPGIQIPMAGLKSEAEIPLEGSADGLLFTDLLLVSNGAQGSINRIDAKTNKPSDPFKGFDKPCGGLVSAFSSVWVPNCGTQKLSRFDAKTGKVTATIDVAVAPVAGAIASSPDSIWLLSDERTTISRIDPIANTVVAEVRVEPGCNSIAFAESALWLTCPSINKVIRIDPRTNQAVNRIEVAAKPISVTAGEGSIWVLCQTDGKVARIDPKTNKVATTIELMIPNAEGNIAFGEGSVWVSSPGFPISRIHPGTDKVVQQFTGEGGGVVYVGLKSVWLVEGKAAKILRFDPKRISATLAD
jgi:glutamine cyclotransferase